MLASFRALEDYLRASARAPGVDLAQLADQRDRQVSDLIAHWQSLKSNIEEATAVLNAVAEESDVFSAENIDAFCKAATHQGSKTPASDSAIEKKYKPQNNLHMYAYLT